MSFCLSKFGVTSLLLLSSVSSMFAERTVAPAERGLFYGLPAQCPENFGCTDWTGVGAYQGQFSSQHFWVGMDTSALKMLHSRFQHFAAFDDTTEALFPFADFKAYDDAEVTAGKPSLFVSATYQGISRPVLWNWYGVTDPLYTANPGRAVNLNDPRFTQYWVTNYIQPWLRTVGRSNMVVWLDNCTFDYNLYGVKDDAGKFVTGVTWNPLYAQNQAEFLRSINVFFDEVRRLDPSIRMGCNTDASGDTAEFRTAFQKVDGISVETMDYNYQGSDVWWRAQLYRQFQNLKWAGDSGKIGLLVWQVQNNATLTSAMRRNYVHYLIVRGDNFFFGPQVGYNEAPPAYYSAFQSALGLPTEPTVVAQEAARPAGYVLYSRKTTGGIVYLNWSGSIKTITLPTDRVYVSSSGQKLRQITLADRDGTYVLATSANNPPAVTLTAPANGTALAAPATISMRAAASDDFAVSRVDFYSGETKLGQATTAPYSWVWAGAPAGTHTLTARAVDDRGFVTVSPPATVSVAAAAGSPSAPANVRWQQMAARSMTLAWDIATGNPAGYRVDVAADAGFVNFVLQNVDVGAVLQKAVTGLKSDTVYYGRVRSYNANGTSASSQIVSMKTLGTSR